MIEKKEHVKKDITVWVETDKVSFDATYECEYIRTVGDGKPGRTDVDIKWISREPINVNMTDADDLEFTWHYGDNMPPFIEYALERYESLINDQLDNKAKKDLWL